MSTWFHSFILATLALPTLALTASASARPPTNVATGVSAWKIERLPIHTPLPADPLTATRRPPAVARTFGDSEPGPFRPTPSPSTDGSPVEQIIVTTEALESAFQVLAHRETRRGVPTVVRTVEWIRSSFPGGDDPARIRTFLREAYDYWGTNAVILGGDSELVPTRYIQWDESQVPSDMYYACLDGEWNEDGDAVLAEPVTSAVYDGFVNDVAVAPDGREWVGTYFGVALLDGGQFRSWDEADGLPGGAVYGVDVASDGTVWAACAGGVARYDGTVWQAFTLADGLPGQDALAVEAVSFGECWVGTSGGLGHYDGKGWEAWTTADGIPNPTVTDVVVDGITVWMATAGGAARLDSGVVTAYDTSNSGILSNWVITVEVDEHGRVWFGHSDNFFARGGLSRFDGVGWVTDDLPAWSGMSIRSFSIEPDGVEFWAATSGGLFHRSAGGDELLAAVDGLAATDCYSTSFRPGGIVVATAAGLSVGAPGAWTTYASESGLPVAALTYDDIDLWPELEIGRIPAETVAEVQVYLQKLTDYQDGVLVDHVEAALLLGENMIEVGDGKAACQSAKALLPPSFTFTELYEVDGTENVPAVTAAMNQSPAWIIDVGHGSYDAMGVGPDQELLFNGDIRGTSTAGRAAMVIVYSCNSGAFDMESSSEAFLFHPSGGAIGVLANTRETMPTTDQALNEAVLTDVFDSSHGTLARSIRDVWRNIVDANPNQLRLETWMRHAFLSRTFQGMPSMAVWRSAPGALAVTHPDTLALVRAPFAVHVTDSATGAPVAGARVCVSKGDEDYVYGITDAAGDVTLDFRPQSVGDVDVVVITPDHVPYAGVAAVGVSSGPSPVGAGWQPSPASAGSEIDLMLAVRNVGLASVGGWAVNLVAMQPEVSVVAGGGTLPPLANGETAWTGPFTVAIDPALLDGQTFRVRLDGAGEVAFQEPYAIRLDAADVSLDSLSVLGDEIFPVVTNHGTGATGIVTATLTSLDTLGTVIDPLGNSDGAGPGETVTFVDGFTVTGPPDARFELTITDAAGRTLVVEVDREAPSPVASLVAEPRAGGAHLRWFASSSGDVAGYRVESSASGGVWVDEFGALVTQGAFADVAIPPGSSVQYRVRAVDPSGNASPATHVMAHANPPELLGWPRRLSSRIGPSPVVLSDLDGNDFPEILLGSMWEANAVHVFEANGSEWADGDADPVTDGVFGSTGGRVHSSATAVDVDDDGSKEIFASSYDGWVYAWRTDGEGTPASLPGWPIFHTHMGLRTAPVAADLDGDADLEIVTVAIDGKIRAFHVDGTPVTGWPVVTGRLSNGSKPVVRDLNEDGRDDLVFGATDSLLYVVSGDGTHFPGWPRHVGAPILCSPALVDLDEDEDFEVVCQSRDGDVVAFHLDDADGTPGADPVAGFPVAHERYSYTPPAPAIGDFDDDGAPEIVVIGGAQLLVLRADGTPMPGYPLDLGVEIVNSPVVVDVDGDGALDILVGTIDRRQWALGIDGSAVPGWPLVMNEVPWSTPAVADLDGDGDLDVALGSNDMYLHVIDAPGPAAPAAMPWPGYQGGLNGGVYEPPPDSTGGPGSVGPTPPAGLDLAAPAPNPFRGGTTLRFTIPSAGAVWLEVFDLAGRRVARPLSGDVLPAGTHHVAWDGRDRRGRAVVAGIYFLRLRSEGEVRTGRAVRIR